MCNKLSREIIGAAIEVHKTLGPGLLESAYEECLCYEIKFRGFDIKRQSPLQVRYKDINLECGYRIDILIEDKVIVELKTVENIEPIHKAQLLTYLRLSNKWLGLLINFNESVLKDGIIRLVNG
ncbi:GxxExxY protein [candidate division WOR-3 bacterium]|nr:GxxExxY protein [candidate division WOR-3 bacterium]MCK4526342.1 GxxExxY protein [candidate division WOR-3 bacterium]